MAIGDLARTNSRGLIRAFLASMDIIAEQRAVECWALPFPHLSYTTVGGYLHIV
jgi:hypothetical protein